MTQKVKFSPTPDDYIFSFRPFMMKIKSKEIEFSKGTIVGFSTVVYRRVNYDNPEDHCVYQVVYSQKLKSGKLSKMVSSIKLDDLSSQDHKIFWDAFKETPEHKFYLNIKKKAQEEFDEETLRRGYNHRGVRINTRPAAVQQPAFHSDESDSNPNRADAINSKIRQLEKNLQEPYLQDKWVERDMIKNLKSLLPLKIENF